MEGVARRSKEGMLMLDSQTWMSYFVPGRHALLCTAPPPASCEELAASLAEGEGGEGALMSPVALRMTYMKAKYMAIVLTMPHSMDLEEPASCGGGDGAAEVGCAAD
jgi:hypothetical protein